MLRKKIIVPVSLVFLVLGACSKYNNEDCHEKLPDGYPIMRIEGIVVNEETGVHIAGCQVRYEVCLNATCDAAYSCFDDSASTDDSGYYLLPSLRTDFDSITSVEYSAAGYQSFIYEGKVTSLPDTVKLSSL